MKLIDRETYKKIKRMNRKELQTFLANVYKTGFREGTEVGEDTNFRIRLSKVLNNTKGVGTVLYDRIMEKAKEVK